MLNNREKRLTDRRNIQGEKTRLQILKTSVRLFAQRGYDNVSIRDIAEKVGVTPSLIMHHFGNKAALYRKMVTQYFENGNIFFRSAIPILKVDASDRQAAANAIAEAIHISFEIWHGSNRVRFVDNLLIQVMLGRGSVEGTLAVEWIQPMKRVFEVFFMQIKPQMTPDELRIRLEIFFSDIFYPAISRNLILTERTLPDFSVEFLLTWKKELTNDFCLGMGLPLPTFIYPEEKVIPASAPSVTPQAYAADEDFQDVPDEDSFDKDMLEGDGVPGFDEDPLPPKEEPLTDTFVPAPHKRNREFQSPPLDSE